MRKCEQFTGGSVVVGGLHCCCVAVRIGHSYRVRHRSVALAWVVSLAAAFFSAPLRRGKKSINNGHPALSKWKYAVCANKKIGRN